MALFRSRDTETVEETVEPEPTPQAVGKGRPTPKRRESERRRKAVVAPKTRKEAAQLQRERMREARRSTREGVARGDQRALAPRDAGPVRAFVRDYVDSRRSIATYFMPSSLFIVVFSLNPVPAIQRAGTIVLLVMVIALIFDGRRLGRAVVREVNERFPGEPTRGLRS